MVQIEKGNKHLSIPAGTLKKYLKAGWKLSKSPKKHNNEARVEKDSTLAVSKEEPFEEYEDEEDVEYVDPEELATRPLSELDKEELQILAEFKGLDPEKYTTAKQLRAALRSLE